MKEYQERVIKERNELEEKLSKLKHFLLSLNEPSNNLVNTSEQMRLRRQEKIMELYLQVLNERIEAFGG